MPTAIEAEQGSGLDLTTDEIEALARHVGVRPPTELSILETALIYGFRNLPDDAARLRVLELIEQGIENDL